MGMVVCGRPDLGEEYLCALIDTGQHGHYGHVDPIVEVVAVLCYPIQHAIYWPDVASEVPPIRAGTVCRLPFLREANDQDQRAGSWAESAAKAQREYLTRCESAAEREIIMRHMAGQYRARRSVRTYTKYELAAHLRAWKEVQQHG